MDRLGMDNKPFTKSPTFTRFIRYHTSYLGSILLAIAFALVGAVCDLGVFQLILHDAVNALEAVSGNAFDEPVSVRYFQREGSEGMLAFDGFEVVLADGGDALKYFLWLLARRPYSRFYQRFFRLWQRLCDGTGRA